jgi:phosphatidylglycerophosphate synthase
MKWFRPRDLLSAPGFLTLVRIPLAVAFPFFAHSPAGALAILATAAASDILDGWCARRLGRATTAGGIADPIADKLFVGSVALTLFATGRLSLFATLLLGLRDLVELPLVVWFAFDSRARAGRSEQMKANRFGKVVTVLQFMTIVAALLSSSHVTLMALLSGASGVVAGITYWARAFHRPLTPDGRVGGPVESRERACDARSEKIP